MTYDEVIKNAKENIGDKCVVCPVCNGKACGSKMPGPGAKGTGVVSFKNYDAWQKISINMDVIHPNQPVDMSLELFGQKFKYPIFAGPVGAVTLHYSDKYNDVSYNDVLVGACKKAGIAAFTGDGANADVMKGAAKAIKAADGMGVPTIKPWNAQIVKEKYELVKEGHPFAVAMDVDGSGLPFLKGLTPPAGFKSVDDLKEIIGMIDVPFIVKGVMTVDAAKKALKAGAKGIIVSNHGGRVLDQCAATAQVLPEIVKAVGGKLKIIVDGGIRTGCDIFKALALGADAVMIARPFVTAVYGGGEEGVLCYVQKLAAELEDTMLMTGAQNLKEINRKKIRL